MELTAVRGIRRGFEASYSRRSTSWSSLAPLSRLAQRRTQFTALSQRRTRRPLLGAVSNAATGFGADLNMSKFILANGLADYYEVLGVDDDATVEDVKKAYRALAKECHPDYLGDVGHNICILLNEAYDTLSNPATRAKYDARLEVALAEEDAGYTGKPLSKWIPTLKPSMAKNANPKETRAVFVDENTCIGCKNCVWLAPATFRMEAEHGRSRVFAQWLDTEDNIQTAIDSCPVSCIHWVQKDDLAGLEYVMRHKMGRTNVGIMMGGYGGASGDVFEMTDRFKKQMEEKARRRAADKSSYSSTQQEARRKAAEDLMSQSFMGSIFSAFMGSVGGAASAMNAAMGSDSDLKVGKRKRAVTWQERQEAREWQEAYPGGSGYSVPPERALVPISVYAREQGSDW